MPPQDLAYRILLAVGLLVVVPILRFHRVRARTNSRALDRRVEGFWMYFGLRASAYAAFLALLAFVIDPDWMAWSALPLPGWVRWIGVAGALLAAISVISVLTSLGTNLTDTVVVRDHHTLITTGPYRWIRHPFYAAFALALASNSLITANWFLALSGLAAVALVVIRTRKEEEKLVERFGSRYETYMHRTGRFFPKLVPSSTKPIAAPSPVRVPAKIR